MSHLMQHFALHVATFGPLVTAAQTLRYDVFVTEMGGSGGDLTDHSAGSEADRFDAFGTHLILTDPLRDGAVIGTTRVLTEQGAAAAGGFATEAEFDIRGLRRSGRRMLEVGRTCLHPDYRGGAAMHHLWQGLAALVEDQDIEILFGLASFPGTDLSALAPPLACLHHLHQGPDELRPVSRQDVRLDLPAVEGVDRRAAMLATPPLVKAYLRLGGKVGEGVFVDRAFGCVDVCMVLDTSTLGTRARALYGRQPA